MTDTDNMSQPPLPTPERPGRHRRKKTLMRRLLLGLFMFLVLAVVAVLCYTGINPAQAFKLLVEGVGAIHNHARSVPPFGGKSQVNILLLGADVSFTDSGNARSDTIKLITVDVKHPRISILSIPRDTWVAIPGHGHSRINAAYQFGGREEADRIALSSQTITDLLHELTGEEITIDHYIRIQTGGFVKIVDSMGGVQLNVEKQMDYEDPSQELYIHLKPGMQRLNGTDAMGYVRFRHDAESDFGRIRRQDQFIHALVAQLTDPNDRLRMMRTLGPALSMMKTDLTLTDMMAMEKIARLVGMSGMQSATLPTTPTHKGHADVVVVDDPEAAAQTVNDALHGPRPTVAIINGSGHTGLAREVSDQLDVHSYNVVAMGSIKKPLPTSQIIAIPSMKGVATQLATALKVAQVSTDVPVPLASYGKTHTPPPVADISVVLGSDYQSSVSANTATPVPQQ